MKALRKVSFFILIGILFVALNQPAIAGSGKVNINTATKNELVALKYIGEKTAVKMIEYRKKQQFEKPQDIMKVKGVGQKTYDANKDVIIVKDK